MAQFLKLKDTTQYIQTMAEKNQFKTTSRATSLKFDITNSVYDEIEKVVREHKVEDIYAKVDMTQAPVPVSFDFKIIRLSIENFRSIEELNLDFLSETDMVTFFSGDNGHGKSSVITALMVGLVGDRLISKYNRIIDADGHTKPCNVRVDLEYNGKLYYITRGSGFTKFAIDKPDAYVSKASKKELEAYIMSELPFLKYLNWFYIDGNKHFFDSVDRTSLIKTCFNLEIFDYLFKFAENEYNVKTNAKAELERDSEVQKHLIESLRETVEDAKSKLVRIPGNNHRSTQEIQSEITKTDRMYKTLKDTYNELKSKDEIYEMKLQAIQECQKLNIDEINKCLGWYATARKFTDSYNVVKNQRTKLMSELEGINVGLSNLHDKTEHCPQCHYVLKADPNYAKRKSELESRKSELESELNQANVAYEACKQACESFEGVRNGTFAFDPTYGIVSTHNINPEAKFLQDKREYEGVADELANVNNMVAELRELNEKYNTLATEFRTHIGEGSTYEIHKQALMSELTEATQYDTFQANLEHLHTSLRNAENKISENEERIRSVDEELKRYAYFKSMFDQSNLDSIPYKIITNVLDTINSDKVHFSSTRQLASGEDRFKVSCAIKLYDDVFIDYDSASNGQKTIMDLYILNKIITLLNGIGLLIMDENLHCLDASNYTIAKEFFQNTPCHDIIVVAHNPNFDGADREFRCVMHDGITSLEW